MPEIQTVLLRAPHRLVLPLLLCGSFALLQGCIDVEDPEQGKDCSATSGKTCAEGFACVQGTCQGRIDEGNECTPSETAVPCADGLVCRQDPQSATNTCQAPATAGTGCAGDIECAQGQVCRRRSPSDMAECQAPAADGVFCDDNSDCAQDLTCQPTEVDNSKACALAPLP